MGGASPSAPPNAIVAGAPMLKAPFPYFGGKSTIAPEVWTRFGNVKNYVEPFFGSGAMLLARPDFDPAQPPLETVNDADGMLANFWRALKADPQAVAHHADWPINETDLHARHAWLVGQRERITRKLEGTATWYDAQAAGWWVWGMSAWIGGHFCSGEGPWVVHEGELVDSRQLPHIAAGQGINRKLPHLAAGRGITRKLPHLAAGQDTPLLHYLHSLADRLRKVRVCCGDFERVLTKTPTYSHGMTAVFLDPPYDTAAADRADCYTVEGDGSVADRAREWAIANGNNPLLRIALCGYEGEHIMPQTWRCHAWRASGGYGNFGNKGRGGRTNATRERIWFSPHCINPELDLLI